MHEESNYFIWLAVGSDVVTHGSDPTGAFVDDHSQGGFLYSSYKRSLSNKSRELQVIYGKESCIAYEYGESDGDHTS